MLRALKACRWRTGWEDSVKIGVTEACKRAAGQFGIGRELYGEAVEVQVLATGSSRGNRRRRRNCPQISPTCWPRRKASNTIMRRRQWTRRKPRKSDTGTVAAAAITPAIGSTTACPKCSREFTVTGKTAERATGSAIGAGA